MYIELLQEIIDTSKNNNLTNHQFDLLIEDIHRKQKYNQQDINATLNFTETLKTLSTIESYHEIKDYEKFLNKYTDFQQLKNEDTPTLTDILSDNHEYLATEHGKQYTYLNYYELIIIYTLPMEE